MLAKNDLTILIFNHWTFYLELGYVNIYWAEADKKLDVLLQLLFIFSVFQNSVYDRETEVKEALENFTNLEKECEGAKQPVSVELEVRMFGFQKTDYLS
jgi:hypothetical protein